ncbi:hypothetical protein IV102_31420 [bacterium]|nr:hypothetical protein [bacterium]
MKIQNAPNPTPPRNLPPTPPAAPEPATPPAGDKVELNTRPEKSFLHKVGVSLIPAVQAAALGAFASASANPVYGGIAGGVGGMMAGYNLGAGGGKLAAFGLAKSGAKAGGGSAIVGGIGALAIGFGAPVVGTLAGAVGGAILPQLASPVVAASILGGATFVGHFMRESA